MSVLPEWRISVIVPPPAKLSQAQLRLHTESVMSDLAHRFLLDRSRQLILGIILAFSAVPALAEQDVDLSTSGKPTASDALTTQRLEVTKLRQQLQNRVDIEAQNSASSFTYQSLAWQLEIYKYLELLYVQHEGSAQREAELREEKEQIQSDLELLRTVGPAESKPYSFLSVDKLQDELAASKGRAEMVKTEIDAAQSILEAAREKYEDAETDRRLAQDTVANASDEEEQRTATSRLEQAKLVSRVMHEAMEERKQELTTARQKQAVAQLRHTFLEAKVLAMSEDVEFSADDLNTCLESLARDEEEIRQQIQDAQATLPDIEQLWLEAGHLNERLGGQDSVSLEQFRTRQLQRELLLEKISLFNQRLEEITTLRYAWEWRYRAVNSLVPPTELQKHLSSLEDFQRQHQQSRSLVEIRLKEVRYKMSSLEDRLRSAKQTDPEAAEWLESQRREIQGLIGVLATNLVRLDATDRLFEKTTLALGKRSTPQTREERIGRIRNLWSSCWNYEIASVDDRPITVGKLILGALFLLIGYAVSRMLSRTIGRRFCARLGMTPGAASALQAISFYLLLIIFGFVSLELANVPLTIFTFLGGAVAIGVGFGSQNLMNNFISGLILLAERPVRVGDLVDIDGVNGTIEYIGARSTRVKTGENLEILVPNSLMLENKVTNWTLSDTQIRVMVSVGVAYGSPTRTVDELLRQAVADHEGVLDSPEPLILFKEFGDNALLFEVHFWVHMRTVIQGERIASEVRHAIDDLFSRANITIAYPQRDVHLDTLKPIEVNLRQAPADQMDGFQQRRAA